MAPLVAAQNSPFSRYSVSAICGVRKGCRRFLGNSAVLAFMALAITVTTSGQSLVVTNNGNTVSPGTILTMNTIPNMPKLVLSVNGGSSCDTVSYNVALNYTDQAGATTEAQFAVVNTTGDQPWTVNWSSLLEGGNATITWQLNGVDQPSFTFMVNGSNPQPNAIDAYASSGPWFTYYLITAESNYNQIDNNGNPVFGAPDGIGLMQLEDPNRNSGDQDYWSWPANVADGLRLLTAIKNGNGPGTGPYASWTAQFNAMVANTGGHPVPANWPSDCINNVNNAACGGFGALRTFYCSFSSSNANGSANGFGDANWIHAYNGSYFAVWVQGVNGGTGHWEYDAEGPFDGYVYKVCTSPPQ